MAHVGVDDRVLMAFLFGSCAKGRAGLDSWSSLRNILAHDYLDVRWDSIRRFIESSEPMYRDLIEGVKTILKASAPKE